MALHPPGEMILASPSACDTATVIGFDAKPMTVAVSPPMYMYRNRMDPACAEFTRFWYIEIPYRVEIHYVSHCSARISHTVPRAEGFGALVDIDIGIGIDTETDIYICIQYV